MTVSVHNPDQYMAALRTIVAQGRKRIGLLVGAGASAGMAKPDGTYPLIPAVAGLTDQVLTTLAPTYQKQIDGLKAELAQHDIETILSRIRSLSQVIGSSQVHDLDGPGFATFGEAICSEIGKIVDVRLPETGSAYADLVNWITGATRDYPVEIFTTNYDLLFEEAFESVRAPYFDGFTGGREPFFDPVSVSRSDLPARWTRLWKLHGSLGWRASAKGEVIRTGQSSASHLVFPEHLKYDQTQKAPYAALLDRLRTFLLTPDTLLISIGFSFADAHIAARIDEALAANPSASVFAFQYKILDEEGPACDLARRLPNFSVYARDQAKVNGTRGAWKAPAELPSKDWGPIRSTYMDDKGNFTLGAIEPFARFFAASRSVQAFPTQPDLAALAAEAPLPTAATAAEAK
ncbi:SIR2 family NAD-dependent protein deacylase [Allosediminivita pacifica]|uniref:SIR2-like protein n=1 Tax=Allosediminivita pacifica TaxID=1267769 RepID=A0A2T6AZC2_9RHOB|nr:SIR2 family protein [Allosediminivita pacifica]PTX49167.1 SIR2-like protein [Allosediminivita pacifica]